MYYDVEGVDTIDLKPSAKSGQNWDISTNVDTFSYKAFI